MEDRDLRIEIIEACLALKNKGLVSRTWGNVSARLNAEEFIITPSGIDYDSLKPEDLVVVRIDNCKYDKSQLKPSSEKAMHAYAYKYRNDVNFVVHTHQYYASAVAADGFSATLGDTTFVPCAAYGLPSTKKLAKNCAEVFRTFNSCNMFFMEKHGAITFGKTMREAIDNAISLENQCETLFKKRVEIFYIPKENKPYLDDFAQMFPLETKEDDEVVLTLKEKNAAAALYAINSKPISKFDAWLQHLIYKYKYSKLRK